MAVGEFKIQSENIAEFLKVLESRLSIEKSETAMEVIAFVGPSGTGKSHRALVVAHENNAECIIDDGILIHNNKIVAGFSAKKEDQSSKKRFVALFFRTRNKFVRLRNNWI